MGMNWDREEETQVVWLSWSDRAEHEKPEWETKVHYDSEGDAWVWWVCCGNTEASGSIDEGPWEDGPDDDHPEGLVRAQSVVEGVLKLLREFGRSPS